ncbi:MAG: xanthine dehydrogenase family protein molybdopterin-binding subunit, partial [Gammaproteobacteria bacterium]|nr:xanthine dehydrogenase family protein molybdopterin-binding subunit [Gammaproteobacteria bacterium]
MDQEAGITGRSSAMSWVGQSIERVEDAALLTGRGRYIDDLGVKPGTLHAAILRSSHAHADIVSIDTTAARESPGVIAVITGADLAEITSSLVASVRAPIDARAIATDRVRYVGEPV